MLQTIHDKVSGTVAKIILGLIALIFVFFGVEVRSVMAPTRAAKVNGEDITLETAREAWQNRQSQLQQAFKGPIPEEIKKEQQTLVMEQLIRSRLLQERVEKQGFHVSDTMLLDAIHNVESLQVDGKFNRDRYLAAVQQQGMSTEAFEARLRQQLKTTQLQNGIRDTAFFTSKEAQRAQALLNEQRSIDYLVITAKSFESSVNVSDADMQSWYESHKSDYLTAETVDLQYVDLRLSDFTAAVKVEDADLRAHYEQVKDRYTTTERRHAHHILIATGGGVDDASAKKQAEEVLAKLKAGGDFAALAKQYSKDTGTASKGGDLGWATRGMFVGPFENQLFAMSVGQISDPVKTDFGYHIIRLDEMEAGHTKSYDEVKSEIESDYRNDRARALFYDKTQKLADDAFASLTELDSVAKAAGTEVKTVKGFSREGGGEFGKDAQVIEAAFSESVLEKGENSPLVTLGEDRALVLRVASHQQPQQKPLAEVRDVIVSVLKERASKQAAENKGKELLAQLHAGSVAWKDIGKNIGAPAGSRWLTRKATDAPADIVRTAFSVPKIQVEKDKPAYRGVIAEDGDYVVVAIDAVRSGGEGADATTAARAIADQRAMQTGTAEFDAYIREMERNAKVDRNPAAFD